MLDLPDLQETLYYYYKTHCMKLKLIKIPRGVLHESHIAIRCELHFREAM